MASAESQQIRAGFQPNPPIDGDDIERQRADWEAAALQVPMPKGTEYIPVDLGGVAGAWVRSEAMVEGRALLFLHGGGYSQGSAITHRELAAYLSRACAMPVLLPDYRLAPEYPLPAAVEDVVRAYRWLLASGLRADQIVIGGDSAGGGLALAALLVLRDRGVTLPAAIVLLSAWLDMVFDGESLTSRASADPLTSEAGLQRATALYLGGANPAHPLASPLRGDLRGLPPMLAQVGSDEVLLSDSTRLAEWVTAAGGTVRLEVWSDMWHVWHFYAAVLPEARDAIAQVGAFVRSVLRE